jgi:hypothetical protein
MMAVAKLACKRHLLQLAALAVLHDPAVVARCAHLEPETGEDSIPHDIIDGAGGGIAAGKMAIQERFGRPLPPSG